LSLFDTAADPHFDAIALGEKVPGKWMAGSDYYRRAEVDQSSNAVETADPKTLVSIAITYRGDQVAIYRNGKQYAAYRAGPPPTFDEDCIVYLGLHYDGPAGLIGPLAGVIEEARIYNVALDAQTIAGLQPNKSSDPKPLAQWTFENGTAADSMGTFPVSELHGSARIAEGKLHLDGQFAYVTASKKPIEVPTPTMFYKARRSGNMWDTWLHFREGTHYLYYLSNIGGPWDNVAMATSPDGVHWKEVGTILKKAEGVVWMGTGDTWKSPNFENDGKFYINFSEWRGDKDTIFFAESTDLIHWTRLGNEYEFKQDARWYDPGGRWDCIYAMARPGGGYYGYWTCKPKAETGGRFGFGETLDGIHWEALPPPKTPGLGEGEAGAVERIGQKYYMMFGVPYTMFTLVADEPQGPFLPTNKNSALLAGHTYFSRFYTLGDDVLVNHHSIARNGQVSFAPLKSTVIDEDGTLRLGWWQGNKKMKHQAVDVKPPIPAGDTPIAMLDNTFDLKQGIILEGTLILPETKDTPRRGLYIECGQGTGSAVLLDSQGLADLGPMQADGSGFQMEKRVDREMQFGKPARFRLLLKGSLTEFYLDDILIECFSLPATATGRIGLIGKVSTVKAWECEKTVSTNDQGMPQ